MGRDKALLEVGGETMVERVAGRVLAAAGSVALIGAPERYARLGYSVFPDKIENCGPLGGLFTALHASAADWNLIVACDMPELTAELLKSLFEAAESGAGDAAVAGSERGLDPLCAVYHRRCAALAASALERKSLKMHDFLATLRIRRVAVADPRALHNVNTPEEWAALS
jgi:molybdenum cofactor guanylyltransferase